jgi:hypothetical protein
MERDAMELRPWDFYSKNRLDFIHVRCIVDTVASTFNLRDDGDVHIAFLREFFLGEFLVASRLADGVAGGLGDVLGLFRGIVGVAGRCGGSGGHNGGSRVYCRVHIRCLWRRSAVGFLVFWLA